jgi:DNA-binding SARP family transcriptional activator
VGLAKRAIDQFDRTPFRHGVESTHTLVAQALWELGQPDRAAEFLDSIGTSTQTPADAQADVAWIAAATGETDTAWVFIEQAARTAIDASTVPSAAACAQYSRTLAHVVDGNLTAARTALHGAQENSVELDAIVKHASISALIALLSDDRADALRWTQVGLEVGDQQGASHWLRWLRLLGAVAEADADGFRRALVNLAASAKLSTLVLADAIVLGLGLTDNCPTEVVDLVRARPARWLPALRRAVQGSDRAAGLVAAELLSTLGTIDDVAILSAFERKHIRQPARRTYSRRLARHANPTMVVHDLGRIRLQLGSRVIPLSQSRRKAASLVAYLAARPSHSAARDQVLDAMWPNQSPEGAANSLHQTLYFLRRDIDPWFEDGHSVDYLVVEPDVVYLDPDLVLVDSAAFFRQVTAAVASDNLPEVAIPLLRDYQAKFALDFEYEEWSLAWRDQLHGLFLELAQATANALLATGRHQSAADVVERALAIDSSALELEATLVIALHGAGATAAAMHQYRHYAKAYEEELGLVPPPLSALLDVPRVRHR